MWIDWKVRLNLDIDTYWVFRCCCALQSSNHPMPHNALYIMLKWLAENGKLFKVGRNTLTIGTITRVRNFWTGDRNYWFFFQSCDRTFLFKNGPSQLVIIWIPSEIPSTEIEYFQIVTSKFDCNFRSMCSNKFEFMKYAWLIHGPLNLPNWPMVKHLNFQILLNWFSKIERSKLLSKISNGFIRNSFSFSKLHFMQSWAGSVLPNPTCPNYIFSNPI